jgi:hypothetical protein
VPAFALGSATALGQAPSTAAIEEIVVIAQKREQLVQDIGIAVAAFSGRSLRERGVDQAEDLYQLMPNANLQNNGGGGAPVVIVRGVGLQSFRINDSPTTAFYVDDVYQTSVASAEWTMFDVERIEVLKGPQGGLYGRNALGGAVESTKSIEGSLAVFEVTWICAAVVLVSLGDTPIERALLVGVVMALFAALVEAVSGRGLDNLLLPLVAFAQLTSFPALTAGELLARGAVMALLALFMLNWRRHLLDFSARLGAALAIYFFWSVGDWRWLVAPIVLLASYGRLMPTIPGGPPRHNFMAVMCIASAGVIWAVANAYVRADHWLWLYTLGFATQQAIIAAVRFSQGRAHWAPWRWWLVATLLLLIESSHSTLLCLMVVELAL